MRDRIAFKVIERTGPMFGLAVLVEEASLREYALALLQYFSTPPSGTKAKIAVKEDHWQRAHTLTIFSQEHAAWIVSLHESRPTHGVGALRIRGARRMSNMLLVACNARTPMRLSFVEPRAGGSDAPAPGSYKFTVEFTTVGINSATGDIMPYTAPTDELRLEMAEAHALVAYLGTRRRRSSSRGRRSLSGTGCALAAGATSRWRFSRIRTYRHSLARVCAPTHTRAWPRAGSRAALAELLA